MITDLLMQVLLLKVYRILLVTCIILVVGITVISIEITFLIIIVKAFKKKNE